MEDKMKKRIKKPPVQPEKAREWLKRYEEQSESMPEIAKKDFFDVRTVRKQIEKARIDRELQEVRQQMLRTTLEKHYQDLCSFAEQLASRADINKPQKVFSSYKDDPLWNALRQHQSRIRLWRDLERWDRLAANFNATIESLRDKIKGEVISRSSLGFISETRPTGLHNGFTEAIIYHLQVKAQGGDGIDDIPYSDTPVRTEHGMRVERGAFTLAVVPEQKVKEVRELLDIFLVTATQWPEYDVLTKYSSDLSRTSKSINRETTKIILRRMIPGRCIYCPF
jgi:hypothetical protein